MLPDRKNRLNRGHTLLELLLVVSIAGLITATGGYLLQALLLRKQANRVTDAEARFYELMTTSLQFAYDQRWLDPFSEEPWMRIETGEGDDWYPLIKLELVIIENNSRVDWIWDAPGSVPVLSNLPTTHFMSHQQPRSLRFKYPEASLPVLREGIAIEGIRETVLLEE